MPHRVRPEQPADAAAVRRVVTEAFGQTDEARLVDALRAAGAARVSLVAEDGEGEVVGHVAFSAVVFAERAPPGSFVERALAVGLAPLAVAPAHQRRGIGSALARAGLARCRELGCVAVVVLGSPEYYGRFGFRDAASFGLACAYPAPPGAFQALELVPGALAAHTGLVRYHAAFDALDD